MFNKKTTRYYLAICWAISLVLIAWAIGIDLIYIFLCSAIFLGFTAVGHIVIFPVFYRNGKILDGFIWGCISGAAIASLLTSTIVYVVGWNITLIFIVVIALPMSILLFMLRRIEGGNHNEPNKDTHLYILILLIFLTLQFYFPYRNLGIHVGDRYLFAWLFGHDFINRMVHVESLSRGVPLKGMFFEGEKLSYYWLAYIFPALMRNLKIVAVEIKQLLQLTQLFYSFLATAALVLLLKRYIQRKKILITTVILALFCYSFVWIINVGIDLMIWLSSEYYPIVIDQSFLRFSGFSHGYYRFFFVEPQGSLAIALILMILTLYEMDMDIGKFILIGICLGILFGVEATNGIMLIIWFCGMSIYSFIIHKHKRFQIALKNIASIACALFVYSVMFLIEMYSFSTGKGALQLSANWFALKTSVIYFPFAYGPPFILGMAGLIILLRKREEYNHWIYQYILLLGIALFFVFFIQNPTEYHFGLLKATRIIPVCLLMLTCYFLQNHLKNKNMGKGLIILIALAFPTLISDNIIASNITNPSTFVRASDMHAARWMKDNLPKDAIIQAEPNYPGADKGMRPKYAYSFIPIFAERMTAIGEWKVSRQEHGKPEEVSERFENVMRMFSTGNLIESLEILNKYRINYIYIGQLEQKLYSGGIKKFKNNPELFTRVYSKQDVEIYRFNDNFKEGGKE